MKPIKRHPLSAYEKFAALPDVEKRRQLDKLDSMTIEDLDRRSKPLNQAERRQWKRVQAKLRRGRPKLGTNGAARVSVTVERSLLVKADALAHAQGLNRSQLFSLGLQSLLRAG